MYDFIRIILLIMINAILPLKPGTPSNTGKEILRYGVENHYMVLDILIIVTIIAILFLELYFVIKINKDDKRFSKE